MNKKRSFLGEFHHVYEELKLDRKRFFKFLRMSLETFDFLLSKVQFKLTKPVRSDSDRFLLDVAYNSDAAVYAVHPRVRSNTPLIIYLFKTFSSGFLWS
jgi:predicted nucleic acid-binding protein